tara:strand:- start:130 stop:909 length:780 start_codon:yes stop_codon:yes gene_type:complete
MASSQELMLRSKLKKIIINFFNFFGYELKRKNNFNDRWENFIVEANEQEKKDIKYFQQISLTSDVNLWSINQCLKYIKRNEVQGDIVECGIYNGNTLSYIGKISENLKLNRKIWGYDTFDGFIENSFSDKDRDFKTGKKTKFKKENISFSKEEVMKNILINDKINQDKYVLIKGDILKTLDENKNLPEKISFLRLDTDIYKTTKKQLEILYPRLSNGGILHIDDYGWAPGVKFAVDEYFSNSNIWLHRVDLTCRYLIKS